MIVYKEYSKDIWEYLDDLPYMPSRADRDKLLAVRVHNIVNDFISKKAQDIVNCLSILTCFSRLSMLSAKAREHGRKTRVSNAPKGDQNAFAGPLTTRDFGQSSSQSRLVEQMAKTFRSTKYFRAAQSFTTTISHADNLFVEDEATHRSNAAPLGQTESWLDRCSCNPARVAQSKRRQISPFALNDQARVAQTWLDCPAQPGKTGIFSKTLVCGVWQIARPGLDLSVSRRRSQDLCLSYFEFAHTRLHANACHRQKLRDSPDALPSHLEIPGNPAIFAARQRCRLLWWLQSAAYLRAVRAAVFVSGHRTDLPAYRSTRAQWRGRRIERLVGACLLGTQTLHFLHSGLSHQSSLPPLVYDGVYTTVFDRHHSQTSPGSRNTSSPDSQTCLVFVRSLAHYRRTDPFHSPSSIRWLNLRPQRILEGEQTSGRKICLGYDHYSLPTPGNLVSRLHSPSLALTQKLCL